MFDRLEREGRGEAFVYVVDGTTHTADVDHRGLPLIAMLQVLRSPAAWARVMAPPSSITRTALVAVHEGWRQWAGLCTGDQALHLAYMLDRYLEAVETDFARLYPGLDPLEMWQARQWRRLHALVTRLPQGSHYVAATQTDEEYITMLAKRGITPGDGPPPLAGWTQEVSLLAQIADRTLLVRDVLIDVNTAKGKQGAPPFVPVQRPATAWDVADRRSRQEVHEHVKRLFLPVDSNDQDEVESAP